MSYKFIFKGKEYELNEEKAIGFFNDEEKPIKDMDIKKIINIFENSDEDEVDFDKEYYDVRCEKCKVNKEDKDYYEYLEFNFYMFTKDSKYIISNISTEYEGETFNKLLREGVVDDSYIVTIIVCKNCGVYSVVIEEFEI